MFGGRESEKERKERKKEMEMKRGGLLARGRVASRWCSGAQASQVAT